jgi:hypothetical protein
MNHLEEMMKTLDILPVEQQVLAITPLALNACIRTLSRLDDYRTWAPIAADWFPGATVLYFGTSEGSLDEVTADVPMAPSPEWLRDEFDVDADDEDAVRNAFWNTVIYEYSAPSELTVDVSHLNPFAPWDDPADVLRTLDRVRDLLARNMP